MGVEKIKASAATDAPYKPNLNRNYKRFCPYGKELFEMRCKGEAPTKTVQIVYRWNLAQKWPRLVITDEFLPSELDFRCLAGLPVQISFHASEAHRVDSLVQEIMKVQPSWLATFALDLVGSDVPAHTIIQPLQINEARVAA